MHLVVATSSWNTVDLLQPFLSHVRRIGAVAVYVMDYGSTDGSAELIRSPEWQALVHVVPFPGLDSTLTSDETLEIARKQYPGALCLFCDPDEFLCISGNSLVAVMEEERWDQYSVVRLLRTNMTAEARNIPALQKEHFLKHLTLSIRRPHVRDTDETWTGNLRSPWIFTAIPDKVVLRLSDHTSIEYGDHDATTGGKKLRSSRAWLQHYPIRSWRSFEEKVKNIAYHMECDQDGPDLGPGHCWHWRRWVGQLKSGELRAEYEGQFIAADNLQEYLADGTLALNDDSNV